MKQVTAGKRNVLYLGARSGTSMDRARALGRLGFEVLHVCPRSLLPSSKWIDRAMWRLGGNLVAPFVARGLRRALRDRRFDACIVDGGECVTADVLDVIRQHSAKVVSYCIDDPTGTRDGPRFNAYRQSIRYYDLAVVMREENVRELHAMGMRNVQRVFMTCDEVSHAPRELSAADRQLWACDVAFIGTWMPERGPLLARLIELGVPLTIRGNHWHKAPEWKQLAARWRGDAVWGEDYAKAVQCTRISIGLLSKGNRDRHTTRSLEIPALGSLLCAERTDEHLALYRDGEEAVFWDTPEDCARLCLQLLADEPRRAAIAGAGHRRLWAGPHLNEPMLRSIMDRIGIAPRAC